MDIVRITELQPKTYVEQGDYIAIDNQSDGTKKVQFTNLLDDTLSQENKIAPANVVGDEIANVRDEVEDEIATIRAAVGSPLKASTVAQMTDKNKIYVYVGSESGYTNGNWYYWNGSAWTSGGVYNSVAVVTDPTLTLSGVPADAKATGDEIGDLKSEISNNMFLLKDATINLKDVNVWEQGTISSSGEITSAHNMSNIYTPSLLTFPIKYEIGLHQAIYLVKYNSGSFVSRSEITSGNIDFDSTFDSYRLMVVGNASTYTVAEMVSQFEYMESTYKKFYDDSISNIINGVEIGWQSGVVNSNGTISSGSNDNYYSDLISREYFKSIEIKVDVGYMFNICKYNGASFVERTSWYGVSDGVISINNNYNYRINIAKETASGSTLEQMLEHFLINVNGDDIPTLRREAVPKSNLNYLNKMFSTYTPNKICHYSVDDTYAVLKDLTDNADSYTSIFDNATLAELKSIHEATGMCVTLNTFNTFSEVPSYSISNVPEKTAFQTEFQANKGWLRFAFHAENDTSNYNTSTGISSAYDTFVTAIYKLTGDYGCIDRITRLGFFGGSLANVLTIKNKTYGVIGLLCADTTNRDSYYLSTDQNKTVQQKGLLLDLDNELVFIKTITRNLGSDAENEILNNLSYQKYVELFSHEYEGGWLTYCRSMCQWAKSQGFVFAFPSDILG